MPKVPGTSHEDNLRELPPEPLVHKLNHSPLAANWWVKTTPGGLLLAFNRPEDATTFFRTVNMAQLMKCPVQVAKIPHALPENHQVPYVRVLLVAENVIYSLFARWIPTSPRRST